MNFQEPPKDKTMSVAIQIDGAGTLTCGTKRFTAQGSTIRRLILEIIGQSSDGHIRREDYLNLLINSHIRPIDVPNRPDSLMTEPYLRRKNNVDKAISRLRKDLEQNFKADLPDGTSWISFSKKIDGWLLYRLPSRGCDGEYHPA